MLPAKKQQIIGRISLFKLKSMVFVSWLPNRHSGASSSPRADSQQESAEATPSANLCKSQISIACFVHQIRSPQTGKEKL